jgi:hypothetical protein
MSWFTVGLAIAGYAYSQYESYQMRKKSEAEAAKAPSEVPYISESDVIPVVFGTIEFASLPIVESTGPRQAASSEPAFSDDSISRWWEWNYVKAALCHGRIDSVAIYIDDEFQFLRSLGAAYGTFVVDGGKTDKQYINGWIGRGGVSMTTPPTPSASLSALAWQGLSLQHPGIAFFLAEFWQYARQEDRAVWSVKPQFPQGLTLRVQRIDWRHGQTGATGWTDASQWQSGLASIVLEGVEHMNPAHIIREVLTDRVWGLGQDEALIDETSFLAAAQWLYDNEIGLSYAWAQETSASDFIADVLRHIDGILYQEPTNGKYVLKLVYTDSNTLHDLTSQSVVVAPPEYSRASYDGLISRVTVIFRSINLRRDRSATVHDLALTEELGDIPMTVRYDGCYSFNLAARLAGRDLRRLSTPLASLRLSVTWSAGKDIRAGDRIQWAWPQFGIFGMRLRVIGVSYGEIDGTSVTLECIEDVLTSAQAIYAAPTETEYIPPDYTAASTLHLAVEVPIALAGLGTWPSIAPDDTRGALAVLARLPGTRRILHTSWDLMTGTLTRATQLGFCQTATLSADVTLAGMGLMGTASVTYTSADTLTLLTTHLGVLRRPDGTDEFVTFRPSSTTAAIIERGVYDTTPYYGTVPSGTIIYLLGVNGALSPTCESAHSDGRVYVTASTVATKALTRTSQDILPSGSAPTVSVTTANRQIRPTCPGYTQATYTAGVGTEITWRRRNRLTRPACTQSCTDTTPEDGTSHRLLIEGLSAATGGVFVLVQDLTLPLADTSYLYTEVQEDLDHKAEGGAGDFDEVRFTLYSTRDGYDSWQRQIRVRT